MVFTTQTYALVGLNPHRVLCEVDLSPQLPAFVLVGLPGSITQESRERVRAAYANSGFDWPARKVTINLLPAHLPKWGSHYELAMALGVLGAELFSSQGAPQKISNDECSVFAFGELSLSGKIRPCRWIASVAPLLTTALQAEQAHPVFVVAHPNDVLALTKVQPKLAELCVPISAETLAHAFAQLHEKILNPEKAKPKATIAIKRESRSSTATLAKVRGEPLGVLAARVALAGRHSALFAGPHGRGKSMLIRGICEASAELDENEQDERKTVLSTFGDFYEEEHTHFPRPVAILQTSISRAGLEGALLSTGQVLPGELTRAHLGILVADEFLEFRRDVLEAFRQPIEEGVVRLQRAKFHVQLPARFQLLASTNLCPCGTFGGDDLDCRCTEVVRTRYQQKLSGPLLDRLDLVVGLGERCKDAEGIPPDLISSVEQLVEPKNWMQPLKSFRYAVSDPETFSEFFKNYALSGTSERGKEKLIRVAQTIAHLRAQTEAPISLIDLRLALLIRQNLPQRLKPKPPSFRNKINEIKSLKIT